MHRYAVWYHLRRLRARSSPQKPVTDGQAAPIRNHIRAAAAVLATLAESGHTLADLRQTDIDEWLADRRVARRAELGMFLRWARRERLSAVAIPVPQWAGPDGRIDHEQRWTLARRVLHDDAVSTEDRLAGLLVVLYAQTAARIRLLRFDHLDSSSGGVRISFGTTPIDLPAAMADLFARLVAERAGTDRAATPWIIPGRPWHQPISADMLRKRLAALGMSTHAARTATLFQLAVDLPAGMLARCLGIDITSAVDWQRAAAGDWHAYAARTASQHSSAVAAT